MLPPATSLPPPIPKTTAAKIKKETSPKPVITKPKVAPTQLTKRPTAKTTIKATEKRATTVETIATTTTTRATSRPTTPRTTIKSTKSGCHIHTVNFWIQNQDSLLLWKMFNVYSEVKTTVAKRLTQLPRGRSVKKTTQRGVLLRNSVRMYIRMILLATASIALSHVGFLENRTHTQRVPSGTVLLEDAYRCVRFESACASQSGPTCTRLAAATQLRLFWRWSALHYQPITAELLTRPKIGWHSAIERHLNDFHEIHPKFEW